MALGGRGSGGRLEVLLRHLALVFALGAVEGGFATVHHLLTLTILETRLRLLPHFLLLPTAFHLLEVRRGLHQTNGTASGASTGHLVELLRVVTGL